MDKKYIGLRKKEIDTPCLILDLDAMERNIKKMQAYVNKCGVNLRPHIKTHKCPQIAKRQIEAGAIGLTCAKLGEAEVMAEAGLNNLLIANQVVGHEKVKRLIKLAKANEVIIVVDDAENVREISREAYKAGIKIKVVIEINIGANRCGVGSGEEALALARIILKEEGLRFRGIMGFEGHVVMIKDFEERKEKAEKSLHFLLEIIELLDRNNIPVAIVSAGGTGTYKITSRIKGITELQLGSYVVMDTKYRDEGIEFENALSLLSTVISKKREDQAIIDSGLKVITTEYGLPEVKGIKGIEVLKLAEEHGFLRLNDPATNLKVGDKIEMLPSHCCTTINLHDQFFCVRKGIVKDVWDIAGRGKSR